MQELKIVLTEQDEIELLDEISLINGKSSLEYATNMLRGFLQSQMKGKYLQEIQKLSTEQIKTLTGTSSYRGITEKLKEG